MTFMLIVCNDGIEASPAEEELVAETIGEHIARIADIELYGHPLQPPSTARTVRVRNGATLVTDGPFVEAKEHIAGFDLLECDTIEEAIAAAASHPLAWFHQVEVRPLSEGDSFTEEVVQRLTDGPAAGTERYMLLIWSDGVPTDAKRETMERDMPSWLDEMTASGNLVVGSQLAGPEAAATVRVRGPHTLVTDGPFVESKEFLAGFDVIDCATAEEAVAAAAAHPVASFHAIEVRPFTEWMCGEPSAEAQDAEHVALSGALPAST